MRAGLFGGCSGLLQLVWVRWAYVGRVHHGRAGHPYAHIGPHVQEKDNELTKHLTIEYNILTKNVQALLAGTSPTGHPDKAGAIPPHG